MDKCRFPALPLILNAKTNINRTENIFQPHRLLKNDHGLYGLFCRKTFIAWLSLAQHGAAYAPHTCNYGLFLSIAKDKKRFEIQNPSKKLIQKDLFQHFSWNNWLQEVVVDKGLCARQNVCLFRPVCRSSSSSSLGGERELSACFSIG